MTEGLTNQSFARPRNVTIALRILWFFFLVSTAVTVAFFALNWDAINAEFMARIAEQNPSFTEDQMAMAQKTAIIVMAAVAVITVLLRVFFYIKIGQGRNWARILFLILAVIGIAYWVYTALQLQDVTASNWAMITHGTEALSAIGTLVALFLLFTGDSNPWFKTRK